MAFFDDLGKKISQTGQNVAQKTKDFADVTKLNGQISDTEKQLIAIYQQLGAQYCSIHSQDSEPAFSAMVEAAKAATVSIEKLKQQVMDLKGIKRCSSCGSEIAIGAVFCNICGAKVFVPAPAATAAPSSTATPSAMAVCPGCGAPAADGASFCTGCGCKLG